jgi:hypothetical protein
MDLPWNPAVLEQRVGRAHRLGQRKPVQVINFIAEGTIEESMLSVLKFKKSLFAGVLDGGEREVFLGGSRLSRFMETVEKTTTTIGAPTVDAGERPRFARPSREVKGRTAPASPPAAPAGAAGWAAVVQTGLTLMEQLATVARGASDGRLEGLSFVRRDPQTGEDYLRIPMPSAEVLDRALQTLSTLLGQFGPQHAARMTEVARQA